MFSFNRRDKYVDIIYRQTLTEQGGMYTTPECTGGMDPSLRQTPKKVHKDLGNEACKLRLVTEQDFKDIAS